jgi:hypothetical protein
MHRYNFVKFQFSPVQFVTVKAIPYLRARCCSRFFGHPVFFVDFRGRNVAYSVSGTLLKRFGALKSKKIRPKLISSMTKSARRSQPNKEFRSPPEAFTKTNLGQKRTKK